MLEFLAPTISRTVKVRDRVCAAFYRLRFDGAIECDEPSQATVTQTDDERPSRAVSRRRKAVYYIDLLRELVVRDLTARYKRSIVGFGWTLLNPVAQMLVLTFVFRYVLPLNIADYPSFLIVGILAWNWFHSSLYSGSNVAVENASLIMHPGFPPAILPVAHVAVQLVHFLLALAAAIPFLLFTGHGVSPALVLLPPLIGLQFLISVALVYLAAPWQVRLRDTQYTLGLFLMLAFYLTPVFYSVESIPRQYERVFSLNPLAQLIRAYRQVLLHGDWPSLEPLLVLAACSAVLLVVGYNVYKRASYHFVDDL